MPHCTLSVAAIAAFGALTLLPGTDAAGQTVTDHLFVEHAGELDDAAAEAIYQKMRQTMQAQYALSGEPAAIRYPRWTRLNSHPFPSATHGNRFINHYANSLARDYGTIGAVMPVGAIITKDALTVMEDGRVFPGPLAIMEKMPAGFDPDAGDWRYVELLPDGSELGSSDGQNRANIGFCVECHNAAPAYQDRLFFVPEQWRR